MLVFDKAEIKSALTAENIYDLLQEWGAEPEYSSFGILATTICHNCPGDGSRKLYYYENSGLFRCYTGCGAVFDIFELLIKVKKTQDNVTFDLNDAVRSIAQRFGLSGSYEEAQTGSLADWKILAGYDRIQEIELKNQNIVLKEFDSSILDRLDYSLQLTPWLKEGISQESLDQARIGFYLGNDQISIPHFDKDGRFIGLRGRTMSAEEAELYGKYRPIRINGLLYNHPLGMNLYNLNHAKKAISVMKKAILFESEKSCLLYKTYFGLQNDISVACCGSSVSIHHINSLIEVGAEEIVIAFDKQFKEIGDEEFQHLKNNLLKIRSRYKTYIAISFIFDTQNVCGYKASPIDEGRERFLELYKNRIYF